MKIPLAIHPLFWLCAGLIGWLNSSTFFGVLIWVGIIFVSVLFHELGHALTAIFFGQKARIQLIAFGGLTSFDGSPLKSWQQFLIVLNGPLFGFGLFLLASWLLTYNGSQMSVIFQVLRLVQIANLFWTVVNLLPVIPLDGGQLLRIVLSACLGEKGVLASWVIGFCFSIVCAIGFLWIQQYFVAIFFFLFAFQNWSALTNKGK